MSGRKRFRRGVGDNIVKSKEEKKMEGRKGGDKMVRCENYVSLFYGEIRSWG